MTRYREAFCAASRPNTVLAQKLLKFIDFKNKAASGDAGCFSTLSGVLTKIKVTQAGFFSGCSDPMICSYFACYINTTDPMYDQAVDMGNNLQDGSRYLIWKDANSSLCTRIGMSNGSDYSS